MSTLLAIGFCFLLLSIGYAIGRIRSATDYFQRGFIAGQKREHARALGRVIPAKRDPAVMFGPQLAAVMRALARN